MQSAVLRLGVEAEGRGTDTTATMKNRLGGAQRIEGETLQARKHERP